MVRQAGERLLWEACSPGRTAEPVEVAGPEVDEYHGEDAVGETKRKLSTREAIGLGGGIASLVSLALKAAEKFLEKGELELAREKLLEAYDVAPEYPRVCECIGRLFELEGRPAEFVEECHRQAQEWKSR